MGPLEAQPYPHGSTRGLSSEAYSSMPNLISPCPFGDLALESYPSPSSSARPSFGLLSVASGLAHSLPTCGHTVPVAHIESVSVPTLSLAPAHPVSPQSLHLEMHFPVTRDNSSLTRGLCPPLLPDLSSS